MTLRPDQSKAHRQRAWSAGVRGLVLGCLLLGMLCAPAVADETPVRDGPSAVSQLSKGELALLQERIANWDELPVEKQEHIARRVLRLRTLSEGERAKLRERIRIREHNPDVDFVAPTRAPDVGRMMAMARGASRLALRDLLDEPRQQALRRRHIHGKHLEVAFLRRFWSRIVETRLQDIDSFEPSALREQLQEPFARYQKLLESPDAKIQQQARTGMAQLVIMDRMKRLMDASPRPKSNFDRDTASREEREAFYKQARAYSDKLGAEVQAAWPEAFEATRKEFAALSTDLDALETWVREHGRPQDSRSNHQGRLLGALMQINRSLAQGYGNAEVQRLFSELLAAVLTEEKVPPERIKQLVEADPQERGRVFLQMLKRFGGQRGDARRRPGAGAHNGNNGKNGRRRGAGPGRGGGDKPRDDDQDDG